MKNSILAAFAILTLASCQQQKIGYMDNGKVVNEYQEKKDIEEKYKGRDEVFKKRADSIGKAFQLEVQKYNVERPKMSKSNIQAKEQELGQKQQILQQQMQFEQQQLQQAFQTEIDSVISRVKTFVKDYGKKNGYNYILGTSESAPSVLYGSEENDLSQTILEALNAKYKKE